MRDSEKVSTFAADKTLLTMKKLPVAFFLFMFLTAIVSGVVSYKKTLKCIDDDVNNALAMTLKELTYDDRVDADTIRCYRRFITIDEIRDTARIAVTTEMRNGRRVAWLRAEAGCSFSTVLMMSDQRTSGLMMAAAMMWLAVSVRTAGRRKGRHLSAVTEGTCYGDLWYDSSADRFVTSSGEFMRLTPMQHELLTMFWQAPAHILSKKEICDRLWPRKADASETLYTLIRRVKPVIEEHCQLKIEFDRGRAYVLKDRRLG